MQFVPCTQSQGTLECHLPGRAATNHEASVIGFSHALHVRYTRSRTDASTTYQTRNASPSCKQRRCEPKTARYHGSKSKSIALVDLQQVLSMSMTARSERLRLTQRALRAFTQRYSITRKRSSTERDVKLNTRH